jgi:hypothetical protein
MATIIVVFNHPFKVETHQKSKAVWVASGKYNGENIAVQDQTEGAAIKRWKEAALNRGS